MTAEEKLNPALGDQYIFLGIDPETKLIPLFVVGKRDADTANKFMAELRTRLNGNGRLRLTTDGFRAYIQAVENAFGADVDYATLTKLYAAVNPGPGRYSPPRVAMVTGTPNRSKICTSYIERHNLTMRMAIRRLTRLTTAFSRKLENLKAALALYLAHYNFCRIHGSLRITPAMAAGIVDRVWDIGELIA